MDVIILGTDLLEQLDKASKFLGSLPTDQSVTDRQQSKDISRSRFATKDISARRKLTEITKVKSAQSVTNKLGQDFIMELVSYFE